MHAEPLHARMMVGRGVAVSTWRWGGVTVLFLIELSVSVRATRRGHLRDHPIGAEQTFYLDSDGVQSTCVFVQFKIIY